MPRSTQESIRKIRPLHSKNRTATAAFCGARMKENLKARPSTDFTGVMSNSDFFT